MKIALVGNQNCGKTTLFNLLTGSNQKIGNWAGVTIERKAGIIKGADEELVDLPGVYSLSPYTLEEEVSRKYVFEEKPDLIINIIDATSIERSLYLTTQLLELDSEVVLVLNMLDIMEKKGVYVDAEKLSKELGVKVFQISALKNMGIEPLIEYIKTYEKRPKKQLSTYCNDIEKAIDDVVSNLNGVHKRFVAVKLLEGDVIFKDKTSVKVDKYISSLEEKYEADMEQEIANQRYNYIVEIKNKCVVTKKVNSISEKIDKVLLNKWLAIPIFICVMVAIYFLSVGVVGSFTVDLISGGIEKFSGWFGNVLIGWGASDWSASLVCDGIISGAGAVLNFVPQLIILFLCISILETTGYMARIAFVLDRAFRKFGLSGKSIIPFIVGAGCSVPGILSSRTIENEKERDMTVVVTPFIPCSAKLPIIALFVGYFFGDFSGLVSVALYLLAILVVLLSSLILKKFFSKKQDTAFLLELPDYKLPSVKYVARDVFDKSIAFVKRAGTIILLCSVVVWFLSSFTWTFKYGQSIENSMLAGIGNCFAWFFYPMLGEWSWAATVSAIQGLVAKEQVVSSMAVIAGLAEGSGEIFANGGIFGFFNSASAFAFTVFNLFSAPCFGAISAMKKELGSSKKMFIAIGFQTAVAWIISCICFGIGSLFLL